MIQTAHQVNQLKISYYIQKCSNKKNNYQLQKDCTAFDNLTKHFGKLKNEKNI